MTLNQLSAYQYEIPERLIAQYPSETRDGSRLMIVDRKNETITETVFRELPSLLNGGDRLIFNNTRVIPARLLGEKPTGGQVEVLLTERRKTGEWVVLAKPGRRLKEGSHVHFGEDLEGEVVEVLPDGRRVMQFTHPGHFEEVLAKYGQMPLPHYMRRPNDPSFDKERYQTVYATQPGAVAAPTAGLHFTQQLLETLAQQGIHKSELTLHVGLGTFLPVTANDIRNHPMHQEHFHISEEAATALNMPTQSRRICVGTTSCRALESAATEEGIIQPGDYATSIFIYPGYQFRYMETLLTNFHLPGSTLLMLVCAFGGYELIMEAYRKAVEKEFRFYSYGDAMLIL